jgi:hypothetical protein
MGISLNLIAKAIELSVKVFVSVRAAKVNNGAGDTSELSDLIEDVSKKIESLASDFTGQVAHQLERQQLDMLSAQAKVVKLALDFGNEHLLGPAVAKISEQIEFSRLRLAEGKLEWFGPWMIAEAVRIEALRIMATTPRAAAVVERETMNFRVGILNHVGKHLIGGADSPWVRIADFVDGRNEDILFDLRDLGALQAADITPDEEPKAIAAPGKAKAKAAAPAPSSVVAPTSWPFPTSSRP